MRGFDNAYTRLDVCLFLEQLGLIDWHANQRVIVEQSESKAVFTVIAEDAKITTTIEVEEPDG